MFFAYSTSSAREEAVFETKKTHSLSKQPQLRQAKKPGPLRDVERRARLERKDGFVTGIDLFAEEERVSLAILVNLPFFLSVFLSLRERDSSRVERELEQLCISPGPNH